MEQGRMNITEHEQGGMRFFAARTGVKDVVTIHGSVLGGHYMLPSELDMVPRLATDIMDAGTRTKSKDEIRDSLARRGASISFNPGGDRTYFHATCLPEDVDFVFKLIADCLTHATFAASEVAAQKKRTLAELEETKTDTQSVALKKLSQLIYAKDHVHYDNPLPVVIKRTEAATRKDLLTFQKLLGKGGLVLAIVGDIQPARVVAQAERIFGKLGAGTKEMAPKKKNTLVQKAQRSELFVADKANIDVYMGASVPLTYDSPEYLAFTVLTSMLGGKGLFGGHLMRTIRERDGLTYGIYASPVGFGGLADGAFRIWATFSPATYQKAVTATLKEVRAFLDSGITEGNLLAKKGELTGKYVVGLGNTNGLASMLHSIGVEGKPLSYIDEYPSLVNAITVKDLKAAAALVPWNSFSIAAAGTFDKKK